MTAREEDNGDYTPQSTDGLSRTNEVESSSVKRDSPMKRGSPMNSPLMLHLYQG